MPKVSEEQVTIQGREFILSLEGPDDARRYNVYIKEVASGRQLTRNPVRGRSPDDAHDRAVAVLHNLVTIEHIQKEITMVAAELATGAAVVLNEDARALRADLAGPWRFEVPFTISRTEVEDSDTDWSELRARVVAHFRQHLRPAR